MELKNLYIKKFAIIVIALSCLLTLLKGVRNVFRNTVISLFVVLITVFVIYPSHSSAQNLWGVTPSGGGSFSGSGIIFQHTGSSFNDIWDFNNFAAPTGDLLMASDGNLYGMTMLGGPLFSGSIFQYNPTTKTTQDLIDFTGNTGSYLGYDPQGSLIQASDGNLYGMTIAGGVNTEGNIFRLTLPTIGNPTGTFTDLIDFTGTSGAAIGANPVGSLMQASDGNLYGMTYGGGVSNNGVIFKYNSSSGIYTKLIDFTGTSGAAIGASPEGSLMQASDGNLYGMTTFGGASNDGVIFTYNISSGYNKLIDFTGTNGAYPSGNLIQASNGNLYGMTQNGGASDDGVIFRYNISSGYTKLIDFTGTNGANPLGSLLQASDGNLYGMTEYGGVYSEGIIFECTLSGAYTDIYDFNGNDGAYPGYSALIDLCQPTIYGPVTVCPSISGNVYTTQPGMSNYTWTVSAGGTIISGSGTNAVTVTWTTSGAVSVSYTNNNLTGCGTTNTTTNLNVKASGSQVAISDVAVNGNPFSNSIPLDFAICSFPVTLGVDANGNSLTYQWWQTSTNNTPGIPSPPSPPTQLAGQTSITYTATQAGTYFCVVTDACSNTAQSTTIELDNGGGTLPKLSTVTQAATVCSGTNATINLTGLVPSNYFTVDYTIGSTTQTPATVTSDASGNGSFTVALTYANNGQILTVTGLTDNSTNCSNTFSTSNSCSLTVNPLPTITGTFSVCVGSTTHLTGSTGGTGTATPSWSTSTPSVAIITLVSDIKGVFAGTSVITYTDNNGCVQTATVTVNPLPTISGILSVCVGSTTTLTGSGTPNAFIPWLSATPSVATITSGGVVLGVSAGTSVITYMDNNGCQITATITVNPLPTISGTLSVCVGSTTILGGNGGSGGYNPTTPWLSATPSVATISNGNYFGTVSGVSAGTSVITYMDDNGCTATATVTVNPNLPVSVSILASANPVCSGTSVTFTATPTNGGTTPSYQWYLGANPVGTNSSTYTYTPSNNDAISCVLTSDAICATGSPATSNSIIMTVNPNLPVSVSILASANPVCSGTSVTFTATPTNGGTPSYQWYLGANPVGTNSSTYTYTPASGDIVTCVLTSNATCATGSPATSNSITMTVNPLPAISVPSISICTGLSGTLTATDENGTVTSYLWTGGANTQSITVSPTTTTTYSVTVTDNNTCIGTGSATVTVNQCTATDTWTGEYGTEWNLGGNWNQNYVPGSLTPVVIPSTAPNQPIITGAAGICSSITIQPGASLSVGTSTTAGTLNCSGDMTILSDATGTGAFTQSDVTGTSVTIVGTVTIQRYIPALGYHYIGSPLSGVQCKQIGGFSLSSANKGFYYDPNIPLLPTNFPNMWRIDEAHTHSLCPADYNSWYAPAGNEVMTAGVGYSINVPGAVTISVSQPGSALNYGEITASVSKEASSTDVTHNNLCLTQYGIINGAGCVNVGTGPTNGWHQIANPYPSPVDWNAMVIGGGVGQNISNGFSIFQPTTQYTGAYGTYLYPGITSGGITLNQYIPSMESFLIQNTVISTSVLTFENAYRSVTSAAMTANTVNFYRTEEDSYNGIPIIALRGYKNDNNVMKDKTVIMFGAQTTAFGIGKLMNTDDNIPNIYVISSESGVQSSELTIDGISELKNDMLIPLGFDVNISGNYTINGSEILNFPAGTHVYLEDLKNNVSQDLTTKPDYSFAINKGDEDNRFYLKFAVQSSGFGVNAEMFDAYSNDNVIIVNYNNPLNVQATLSIFNVLGQNIKDNILISNGTYRLSMGVAPGAYIVRLVTNDMVYVKKVYL